MTENVTIPAFIEPVEGAVLIPVQQCTRADIRSEITWTDSLSRQRELRALLRLCGDRLQGDVMVGEVMQLKAEDESWAEAGMEGAEQDEDDIE